MEKMKDFYEELMHKEYSITLEGLIYLCFFMLTIGAVLGIFFIGGAFVVIGIFACLAVIKLIPYFITSKEE